VFRKDGARGDYEKQFSSVKERYVDVYRGDTPVRTYGLVYGRGYLQSK
jgi:hypothetical protein